MFLKLAHTKLDVYQLSRSLVLSCYQTTKLFPNEEKFTLVQQIRRAAISVHLNLAEGCSRITMRERKRFFEISRSSVIEVDTAFDLGYELSYVTKEQLNPLEEPITRTFKILSAMIKKNDSQSTTDSSTLTIDH
ncbi:MAG TPA: four helix bundle protein [Chitinophagaceae bacterium]|nr:four helix bundle protein [Chitinophagaceae bacterium]